MAAWWWALEKKLLCLQTEEGLPLRTAGLKVLTKGCYFQIAPEVSPASHTLPQAEG